MYHPEKQILTFNVLWLEELRENILHGDVPEDAEVKIDRVKLAEILEKGGFSKKAVSVIDELLYDEAERQDNVGRCVAMLTRRERKYTVWDALYEITSYYPELRAEDVTEIIHRLNEQNRIIV